MTGPDPNSPFTPPQPPPPPPPTGDQGGSFYPNQPENWYYPTPPGGPQDQERNIIGIIALAVAILGFICACIPLLFIVGWVLLAAAIVLSIIGLAQSGKTKGTSIAALITAIVGCIVGVIVFTVVQLNAFADLFSKEGDTPPSEQSSAPDEPNETHSGEDTSVENPAPMGTTFNSEEWDVTVVNFDPDMTDEVVAEDIVGEEPEDGYIYGVAELELTYTGDGSEDPWFDIELAYVTEDDDVINYSDSLVDAPDNDIFGVGRMDKGDTETANFAIEIPEDDDGVLQITPGWDEDDVFVQID